MDFRYINRFDLIINFPELIVDKFQMWQQARKPYDWL